MVGGRGKTAWWGAIGLGVLGCWLGSGTARAQEADCAPLSPEGFRALTEDARSALFDDDAGRVARIMQSLRAQVRCLSGPVPSEAWARLLYGQALVAYAEDEAWEPLVTAALRADADLVRDLGPPVLRGFEPGPPQATHDVDLPSGEAFLDGRPIEGPFELVGPHVLQRREGSRWVTVWVDDGAVPEGFATSASSTPASSVSTTAAADDTNVEPADEAQGLVLRLHAALGIHLSTGPEVVGAGTVQPAVRVSLPVEVGLELAPGPGWLRLVGAFTPQLSGPWVYTVDGTERASALAGGAHLAGGGRFGVGHVGALVGIHVPGRITAQAVGGATVLDAVGLRIEGRAGVHYTTADRVEPAFDLALVVSPRLWGR